MGTAERSGEIILEAGQKMHQKGTWTLFADPVHEPPNTGKGLLGESLGS
jgi:hypothetical protein